MFERCRRQWFVTYYLGFLPAEPAVTGNSPLGTRVHTALEGYYGPDHFDPLLVLDLIYAAEREQHPEFTGDLNAEQELAKIMVAGYLEWVAAEGKDSGLKVLQAEEDVSVDLPGWEGAVLLRGKMDAIVGEEDTGLFYFIDHKTGADFKRAEIVRNDPQMKTYSLIQWLKAGYPPPRPGGQMPQIIPGVPIVGGGMINTLRRVKRSKAAKPPFYDRTSFRHTPEQLASHLLSLQQVCAEITAARAQLDGIYAAGGSLAQVNWLQHSLLRPNFIAGDCDWRCPLVGGLCQLMDDGDWATSLADSGRWVQGDPYAYYNSRGLDTVRQAIASAPAAADEVPDVD